MKRLKLASTVSSVNEKPSPEKPSKHNRAASVFRAPSQLSFYDEEHSDREDRWITIGLDNIGILRVVVHTFEQINEFSFNIRIISARRATQQEAQQYQQREL